VVRSGTSGASKPLSATIGSCHSARADRPFASTTTRHRMAQGKSVPASSATHVRTSATRGVPGIPCAGHGAGARSASGGKCPDPRVPGSQSTIEASSCSGSVVPAPIPAVTAAARKVQSVDRFLASSSEWSRPSAALASDSRIRAVSRERRAPMPTRLSCGCTRSPDPAAAPRSHEIAPVSAAAAAIRTRVARLSLLCGRWDRVDRPGMDQPPSRARSALADALAMPLSPTTAATDTEAAPCTDRCTDRLVNAQ
jgi:hypothetical protein